MMRSTLPNAFQSICIPSHEDIARLATDSRGVTAIEYALIAALIAVAAIAAFSLVGTDLSNTFSSVASQL
jgi:pilus assembly protein Flp/PilA